MIVTGTMKTGYQGKKKCISEYETWRKGGMDKWTEFRIWVYNDGTAVSSPLRGPFSEKEYFKLKLQGTA